MIAAQAAVRDAVRAGALASAHDIAEGGLAVALAECCLAGAVGASVELGDRLFASPGRPPGTVSGPLRALFGEGPGGFLVSGPAKALAELGRRTPLVRLGTVGGEELRIALAGTRLSLALAELRGAHASLGELFA